MERLASGNQDTEGRTISLKRTLIIGLIGAILFGTIAWAGIQFTRSEGRIAAVWIPNALAVAFLLRYRFQNDWLFIAMLWCGNIAANIGSGDTLTKALGLASSNSLEIGIAVYLTRHLCCARPDMQRLSDLSCLIFASAIVAPVVSGILAVSFLPIGQSQALGVWAKWAIADGLGMAIIVPASLIFHDAWQARRLPSRSEALEWSALTIAGTTATLAIFLQMDYPLLFLIAPIVLSHAFRLGALGTAFSIMKVAIIASICTSAGLGPINLIDLSMTGRLIILQAFIASSFLLGLPIAAALAGRSRMTIEIEQNRKELALLADTITDAVLRYDLNGLCTYASPSVAEVLGEDPEIFIGNKASDRMHPDAKAKIIEAERKLLSGACEKERFTYRRYEDGEDGNPVYIEADCAIARNPLTAEAEGIVVSARDVTARVELELQLVRARRHAENAAKAKSEFLANMSHEIRTPMNGVLGFAELLMQSELDDEQRRHSELIVQSGRSMMLLLNDILDLSKIEAGQIVIERQPVDIRQLLEECIALHLASAEKKGLAIELECDEGPWILTDGLRIRQIVLNLLGNAIKFTESGTVIVSLERKDDQLSIEVIDSGIGIGDDKLDLIFNPFEQGENDTTRRYGGTGLGLSISRQLAELLGGFLEATSTIGVGSRFRLTLPMVEAAAAPKAGPAKEDAPLDRQLPQAARILLAEDHDVNRLLVTEMLQRCGQNVQIAQDGNEAIAEVLDSFMRDEPFDLVLMDIQMPGCDGYAATRAIREEGIGPDRLPIIALTANAFPEDISAARDAGMQAHLAKPLVFSELLVALQRWLPTRIVEHGETDDIGDRPAIEAERQPSIAESAESNHSPALLNRWQERRREAIEAVSTALRSGKLTGCDGDDLARMVHKLAGTAGMFGEEELGERAAAFERALRSEVDRQVREELAKDLLEAA